MAGNKKKQQKKKQQAKAAATTSPTNGVATPDTHDEEMSDSPEPQTPTLSDPPAVLDLAKQAEKQKELGNTAFTSKKFQDAVEHYSRAIEYNPNEPNYSSNRAAAYMALKKYKPATADCQHALSIQGDSPSAKVLIRLARCQLYTGHTAPALSALRTALSLEPKNDAALQLQKKILELEDHVRNFERAKGRKDWGMARLALDKCSQVIDAEGGEIPLQWRVWKVELELAKGNWDAASIAANDAMRVEPNSPDIVTVRGLVMFLTAKMAQALQHAQSALRLDPGHEPAMRLRKRVKDVDRLKEEGNTAFKTGQLEEAVTKYGEAIERIGADDSEGKGGHIRAMLLSNRATALLKLGRYEEALSDTDISIELNKQSFKVHRTRARINLKLEKYESAVGDFRTAIEYAESEAGDAEVRALRTELKKAEVDLKRSKTKDYYKILGKNFSVSSQSSLSYVSAFLGVSRDCTEIEIKKAYRRESLKHHPDKVRFLERIIPIKILISAVGRRRREI
ncbi:hypothetical protein PHLCEN_2v9811 [Hermanssonia centrifuga]|uniref:J domain-containing protein n=1 Tax=Hermanssonia centrifuga TaxID=98765 RepID=A0A2R6NQH4_9APHY|nr:hypothetical protein PHLCEN_2v9811 [Hermanssonia centrifuga]